MQQLALWLIFILFLGSTCGVISLKVFNITGPDNPEVGSEITLKCNYDKQIDVLYSVKWYHKNIEFYRFLPSDYPNGMAFHHYELTVNTEKSDDHKVTFTINNFAANGTYACEVAMEAPSFVTASVSKAIHVRNKTMIPPKSKCNLEKEHFRPNRTYLFKYEIEAISQASITTTGKSGFFIFCDIQLDANGKCEYSLNVTSCGIRQQKDDQQPIKSNEFSTAIARYPVLFTMINGVIEELVAHEDEPIYLLNFKRGIISTLLVKRYPSKQQAGPIHQMRTDVQGTCPVTYSKDRSEWWLTKDMNKCHFPSRVDWSYSPLSMIWNMSTIYLQFISHYVSCAYEYNSSENLENIKCIDHSKVLVRAEEMSATEVEVFIGTNLKLVELRKLTSWANDKRHLTKYHRKDIQYEYERVPKPTKNPEEFVNKVTKLLSELSTNPEKEIDPETANKFDNLIDLLRNSANLSVLGTNYTQCWNTPDCTNIDIKNEEIQKGQIWRNALIQCNTAACTRAFRAMLSWNPKYLKHVVSETDLHLIFHAWTNARINDVEHIQELLEIVKLRPDDTFLLTSLATIIHDFWNRQNTSLESNIPSTFQQFVQLILKPIDENCLPAVGFKDANVRAALQAIRNLGPLFQTLHPSYVDMLSNCITGNKLHYSIAMQLHRGCTNCITIDKLPWSISWLATQAASNMEPTYELYIFLMNILKNPALKHEDNAAAYIILSKKFGGVTLVADILKLLKKIQNDRHSNNLRTLIVSHMRTVAKTWDPNKLEFVKAIREAMAHNPNLFRAMPEEKIHIGPWDDLEQNIPWDIQLDQDFKFEEGYFSKYEETSFKLISPILRDIFKVIGYKLNSTSLHSEDSYLAYATWLESQAYGFGHIFKGNHISVLTTGVINLVQKMNDYAGSGKLNMTTFYKMYQNAEEYLQKAIMSQNRDRVSKEDFPNNIDSAILQTLINLHNKRIKATSDNTVEKDIVFQYGSFAPMTMEDFGEAKKGFLYDLYEKFMPPHNTRSNYWKAIESAAEFPTLTGLPLRWTLDGYLIHNQKLNISVTSGVSSDSNVKIDGSFSGLGTLKQGMHLDLPTVISCGAQMFTSLSTSVGAVIDLTGNIKKKKVHIHLELPQRPMQLLSFKRTFLMTNKYPDKDVPEYPDIQVNENWCSNKTVPITGFRICHSHTFVNISDDFYRECVLLAGNSNWDYTTDYIAKQKGVFQFMAGVSEHASSNQVYSFEAELKSLDAISGFFKPLIKMSHKANSAKKEFETEVVVPMLPSFRIWVTKETLKKDGTHIIADLGTHPLKMTHIEYMSKITEEKLIESNMNSQLNGNLSSEPTYVKTSETTFNYKSPTASYEYKHKCHKFPQTTFSDTVFAYKKMETASSSSWVPGVFNDGMFWNNENGTSVNIHHEVRHSNPRGLLPEQSYTTVVLPQKIYTLTTLKRTTTSRENTENNTSTFTFNITAMDPATHKLLDYFNFTNTLWHKYEYGIKTTFLDANVTVPLFSCAMQVSNSQNYNSSYYKNLTIILRREELWPYSDDSDVQWWTQEPPNFVSRASSVKLTFGVRDVFDTNWVTCTSCQTPFSRIANQEFSSSFQYHPEGSPFEMYFMTTPTYVRDPENIYRRNYSIRIPTGNTVIDGEMNYDGILYSEVLIWTARVHLPNDQTVDYRFKGRAAIRKEGRIYMTESLNSEVYKRNSHLVLDILDFRLAYNITAQSPIEPMLEVDLQLTIEDKKSKLKVAHILADIAGEVSWQNGYNHLINVKTKDKDFLPNIEWKANFSQVVNKPNLELRINETDVFFTYVRTELNNTRLKLDTCHQPNCTFDPDSENFVGQMEWSLENPQELARTVIYNPKMLDEIGINTAERINMIQTAFNHYFLASGQKSPILKWKNTILDTYDYMIWAPYHFVYPFHKIRGYLKKCTDVVLLVAKNLSDHFSRKPSRETILKPSYFCWTRLRSDFYLPFNQLYKPIPWHNGFYHTITDYISVHWYKSGPVPGRSYVTTTSLPVYWTQFNRYPLQISPSFSRKFNRFKENPYYDEQYTRHALLVGTGDIYTFDGKVQHLQKKMSEKCTYLLSHDFVELKFSIYYHDLKVHFIFPEMSLTISQTGCITVNQTLETDLPIGSWNRNIRVTRQNNLIEVTTPYKLKVICNTNNFYCLFYTNGFKFNQVIGLLGNNNDNPKDDSKDPREYELSGDTLCKNEEFLHPILSSNESTFLFSWNDLLWKSSSATLPCHDIISIKEFFVPAYIENPIQFPCSLMNGYLALCRAKGIMTDQLHCNK